jgi:hypothetical protein
VKCPRRSHKEWGTSDRRLNGRFTRVNVTQRIEADGWTPLPISAARFAVMNKTVLEPPTTDMRAFCLARLGIR